MNESSAELKENEAMQRAAEDGPAAMEHLKSTKVYREASRTGVPANGVESFVWELTFALGREGLLRQLPSGSRSQ